MYEPQILKILCIIEIVRAYITNLQDLPTITGRKINMIYEYIKALSYNVQLS